MLETKRLSRSLPLSRGICCPSHAKFGMATPLHFASPVHLLRSENRDPIDAADHQELSMTARFSSLSHARRRLLVTISAVTAAALTAMAGLSPVHSAGGQKNGGDITF